MMNSLHDPRPAVRRIAGLIVLSCACLLPMGCTGGDGTAGDTGGGTPDVIETAEILPNPAFANNRLEVTFDADPWKKPSEFAFTWKRNGDVVAGVSGGSLDPVHFRKGDEISVEVSATDSTGAVSVFRPSPIRIRNTPPKIMNAATIVETKTVPEIRVEVKSLDVDGDHLTFSHRWFRNGKRIENETGPTLDPSTARRGDQIYAEVTASDGESTSAPIKAEPVKFENNAPQITSAPPASVADGLFVYQVEAGDPDSDELFYELVAGPDNMSMDGNGRVTWVVPSVAEPREPSYVVKIRVRDDFGGEAIQEFRFSLGRTSPPDSIRTSSTR